MSCPYTSSQNGKVEPMIRSINNIIRSMLFQASLALSYWVEGLYTATYLINRLPTKALALDTPYFALFGSHPSYDHLCVFGCACYPNMSVTAPHKLAPWSSLCIFLGYSSNLKGYRRLDLLSNRLITSHHVVLDETCFPLASSRASSTDLDLSQFEVSIFPINPSLAGPGFASTSTSPTMVAEDSSLQHLVSSIPLASASCTAMFTPCLEALPSPALRATSKTLAPRAALTAPVPRTASSPTAPVLVVPLSMRRLCRCCCTTVVHNLCSSSRQPPLHHMRLLHLHGFHLVLFLLPQSLTNMG
ncbi:hypothetical protein GUJ93_ZPchr0012g21474 [Zizania palustris]|uniref:Retroviral polymerase SH3-like domain-containing protein n=1 Tax=Zizania palustris TaxID=103762 RepID=A0A8J6BWI3_ZIZPA|nr:hypothetical protein GUJ93_ZPchr0012g21474 [Zizania palustris]